jgi:hypothetical protein
MKYLLILFFVGSIFRQSYAQTQIVNSVDTVSEVPDTLKSFLLKSQTPTLYQVRLNHFNAPLGNKILRGLGYSLGYDLIIFSSMLIVPDNITMWTRSDKFKLSVILSQYQSSFTSPPVLDKDHWYVNYIGHPYQGAFYYNSMRSQGSSVLESSLFCLGQSVLWEYVWEGGMEQPSIQDLIVTPVIGSLVGELSHIATVKMSKNGYMWYEKVLICIINPTYAFNNGFKLKRKPIQY